MMQEILDLLFIFSDLDNMSEVDLSECDLLMDGRREDTDDYRNDKKGYHGDIDSNHKDIDNCYVDKDGQHEDRENHQENGHGSHEERDGNRDSFHGKDGYCGQLAFDHCPNPGDNDNEVFSDPITIDYASTQDSAHINNRENIMVDDKTDPQQASDKNCDESARIYNMEHETHIVDDVHGDGDMCDTVDVTCRRLSDGEQSTCCPSPVRLKSRGSRGSYKLFLEENAQEEYHSTNPALEYKRKSILPKKYLKPRCRTSSTPSSPPPLRHHRRPCRITCCARQISWPRSLTWSACCEERVGESGAEDGDVVEVEEEPFRKRCSRACFTFIYILLATVAVVVTYSMIQDLINSMNNPVRSIHYRKVTDYDAPGEFIVIHT